MTAFYMMATGPKTASRIKQLFNLIYSAKKGALNIHVLCHFHLDH